MQTCILPNLLVEALLVVQSLGCLKEASLRPRGEESDISPEVDDVMVVAVVVVVIREGVPRVKKEFSSEMAFFNSPPLPRQPASESESESESPVKGTERIWLARCKLEISIIIMSYRACQDEILLSALEKLSKM